LFMIVYNYDADLEVSDTCVRSSLLSWVELSWVESIRSIGKQSVESVSPEEEKKGYGGKN